MLKLKNRKLFGLISVAISLGILGSFAFRKTVTRSTHRFIVSNRLPLSQQMSNWKASLGATSIYTTQQWAGSQNTRDSCGVVGHISTNWYFLSEGSICLIKKELQNINIRLGWLVDDIRRAEEKFKFTHEKELEILEKANKQMEKERKEVEEKF